MQEGNEEKEEVVGRCKPAAAAAAAAQYVTCCIWLSLTSGHISVIHFAVPAIEYK